MENLLVGSFIHLSSIHPSEVHRAPGVCQACAEARTPGRGARRPLTPTAPTFPPPHADPASVPRGQTPLQAHPLSLAVWHLCGGSASLPRLRDPSSRHRPPSTTTAHSLPPAVSSYPGSSSLADASVVFLPEPSPLVCCRPRSPPQDRPGLLWGLWLFLLPPGRLHRQDRAWPLDRDLPPPVVFSFLCFVSRSQLGSLSTWGALVPPSFCTCCSFTLEISPPSSHL